MKGFILSLFFIFLFHLRKGGKEVVLKLGTSKCIVHVYKNKRKTISVVRLHPNENTCIRSFFQLPSKNHFALYQLSQRGKRLLEYRLHNRVYYFDPNRIFSKRGIINILKEHNLHFPKSLVNKIAVFSKKLLATAHITNSSKHIIAIHNNSNGEFSVETYSRYSKVASHFISHSKDADDFFIVTSISDFKFFKKHNENVVLQSKYAKDDGSLSVFCQRHNIPYINVEAQYGHIQRQKKMLLLCEKLLTTH